MKSPVAAAGTLISSEHSVLGVVECSVLCFVSNDAILCQQFGLSLTSGHKQLCKMRRLSPHRTKQHCCQAYLDHLVCLVARP